MKNSSAHYIDSLIVRYPRLAPAKQDILKAIQILVNSYRNGGKLLICGNGGSAADSEHIVGELMKGFVLPRPIDSELSNDLKQHYQNDGEYIGRHVQKGLPAISLVSEVGLSTAFSNDQAPDLVFAQQVLGYGKKGDVLLGISTSGNSKNVVYAIEMAKELGILTIGLTGEKDSHMSALADITIRAGETETFKIQECHLPIYHAICLALEEEFFGKEN
jgi:D-sedoheptulose 7-phosphate isomerase